MVKACQDPRNRIPIYRTAAFLPAEGLGSPSSSTFAAWCIFFIEGHPRQNRDMNDTRGYRQQRIAGYFGSG